MIVPPPRKSLASVFIYRGTTVRQTWPQLLITLVVALGVTLIHQRGGDPDMRLDLTPLPFQLIGLALSSFLAFHTNAAYDRWWEGRKLWGGVVNITRSIVRQMQTFARDAGDPDQPAASEAVRTVTLRTIAWTHALNRHLRPGDSWDRGLAEVLRGNLPDGEIDALRASSNPPIEILRQTGQVIRSAYAAGQLSNYELVKLEDSLERMTDLQGGCERIRNTPLPWGYAFLLSRLVFYYCLALPLGIVATIGWMTPVVTLAIAVALFGLNEIAGDIADPFADCPNSLPMDALATTIETNLREAIGQTDQLPPSVEAVAGVLR